MLKKDYLEHGIWTSISNVETCLAEFDEEHQNDERYSEFTKKIEYLRWLLETSDCALISETELQATINEMAQVAKLIPNNANNWGHYPQISDQFASTFIRFPYPRMKKIFRSEANEIIDEITLKISTLSKAIDEASGNALAQFDEARTEQLKIKGEFAEIESKIANSDARIQAQFDNWEATNSAQIVEKISEFSEVFSTAQAERSEAYQDQKNAASSALANIQDILKNSIKLTKESQMSAKEALVVAGKDFEQKAKLVLENLDGFYDKAGQKVLSADFVSSAEQERRSFVSNARFAKLFFLIAAAVLGYMYYLLSQEGGFQFSEFLKRLPVSAMLLVPGFYFASLANQHRKSAVKLRSLGLRIKAFDAYLVNAEDSQKRDLRKDLAKVFFEDQQNETDGGNKLFSQGSKNVDKMVGLLEKAIDKIPTN